MLKWCDLINSFGWASFDQYFQNGMNHLYICNHHTVLTELITMHSGIDVCSTVSTTGWRSLRAVTTAVSVCSCAMTVRSCRAAASTPTVSTPSESLVTERKFMSHIYHACEECTVHICTKKSWCFIFEHHCVVELGFIKCFRANSCLHTWHESKQSEWKDEWIESTETEVWHLRWKESWSCLVVLLFNELYLSRSKTSSSHSDCV